MAFTLHSKDCAADLDSLNKTYGFLLPGHDDDKEKKEEGREAQDDEDHADLLRISQNFIVAEEQIEEMKRKQWHNIEFARWVVHAKDAVIGEGLDVSSVELEEWERDVMERVDQIISD